MTSSVDMTNTTSVAGVGSDRKWALLCHLSAFIVIFGIPFGHLIGPLIIWLMKRDDSDHIDRHGRASLNFQLTMTLLILSVSLLGIVSFFFSAPIGFEFWRMDRFPVLAFGPMLIAIALVLFVLFLFALNMVLIIVNSLRAYDGLDPSYWPSIPFLGKSKA